MRDAIILEVEPGTGEEYRGIAGKAPRLPGEVQQSVSRMDAGFCEIQAGIAIPTEIDEKLGRLTERNLRGTWGVWVLLHSSAYPLGGVKPLACPTPSPHGQPGRQALGLPAESGKWVDCEGFVGLAVLRSA